MIKYLVPVKHKKPSRRSHIWNESDMDSYCRMWSTGGLRSDFEVKEDTGGREICKICELKINQPEKKESSSIIGTTIMFGKFQRRIFINSDGTFGIYSFRIHGGNNITVKCTGDQPEVLKSVEFKIVGSAYTDKKYGRQIDVEKFDRVK